MTTIEHTTFAEMAACRHPNDPEAQARMVADIRKARTEVCSACGTETHRINAFHGPLLDDGGHGVYDICRDCWKTASKVSALLGIGLEQVAMENQE